MSSIKSVHEDRICRRRSKFQEQLIVMLQLVFPFKNCEKQTRSNWLSNIILDGLLTLKVPAPDKKEKLT